VLQGETIGALVCFALAGAFAVATVYLSGEGDASANLMRVEADFSVAPTSDLTKRGGDGKIHAAEKSVDAVYVIDGTTYRHRVSEEYAVRFVKTLPGKGFIVVDANDPARRPRAKPGFAGAPLLASVICAMVGITFGRRSRNA
jgi:hypothetical protein